MAKSVNMTHEEAIADIEDAATELEVMQEWSNGRRQNDAADALRRVAAYVAWLREWVDEIEADRNEWQRLAHTTARVCGEYSAERRAACRRADKLEEVVRRFIDIGDYDCRGSLIDELEADLFDDARRLVELSAKERQLTPEEDA